MGFVKRGGGERQLVDEGDHAGVCVDIVDLGLQSTKFGDKHRLTFVYATEGKLVGGDFDGQNMLLFATHTNTSSPQGNLRPFIESWSGESMTDDQIEALEISDLVGQPATLTVEHNEDGTGNTYANIGKIGPGTDDETLPEWMTEAQEAYTRPEKLETKAAEGQKRARDADKPAKPTGAGNGTGRKRGGFGKR